MSVSALRSAPLVPSLALVVLAACQDASPPTQPVGPKPQFAQGDGGVYTVNSLLDPGDGTCDDTECTLREAIAAASGITTPTRIEFSEGLVGEILLTVSQLDLVDMNTTIDGDGRISVNAAGNARVMRVLRPTPPSNNPTVSLIGLTFKNGSTQAQGGTVGGAILASGTGLILFLEEVTLSTSAAVESGGGIGLLGSAAVTVRNSIISDNTADLSGGGIYVAAGSSLTLINTTVEGNTTQGDGGGIFNAGDLVVTGSSISGNEASGAGGALYNASTGEAGLVRSTLSGNTSSEGAGGITNLGELSLRSSTVTLNGSTDIGGAGGLQSFTPSTAQVANSIIAGNSGTSGDCSGGGIVSLGHNLQTEDASPCPFSEPGDIEIEKVQLFTQVLEEELKDNGGPTTTHALLARGLAVDAGYCPGETSDQRGFTRPVDDPVMANAVDGCDIGAHEVQGPVTPVADLMVSQSVNKTSVKQGELLTYFIRVQNLGPQTAPAVVLSNILSSGVTFVEARHAKGTHTAPPKGETGTVTWFLGDLLNQANEVAEIEVTVLVKGKTTITNNASVTGDVNDPNTGNNSAAITVSVVAGTAGKGGKSR